jgi:N-acetyl-gamma-glutamyl-phosphate reductase common form
MRRRVGIVGARGYVGEELMGLLGGHPDLELAFAVSREPKTVGDVTFEPLEPADVAARGPDAVVLALPDGVGQPYLDALPDDVIVVDLSADHRFDDTWVYGLPELHRDAIAGARRIANPGCYATAMQLAIAPFLDDLEGPAVVFGVSGWSGAGTKPSPRNDPERLRDNLLPYGLVGHTHEREATRHLGHPVCFMPHVHPAFRGLLVTVYLPVHTTTARLRAQLAERYTAERLIEVQEDPPQLRDGTQRVGVLIGGAQASDGHAVVVAAEDNLGKGAAVQALQNLNLAFGLHELSGIPIRSI